ncbi:energy transducer TonB [Undibacterium sp.]|uniref:energy transducer TonB n=1 Tax=Undibacterium sp. TaxID=1914977 RepID=UPI00374D5CE4
MIDFFEDIPTKIMYRFFVGIFIMAIHYSIFWCLNESPHDNISKNQQKSFTASFLNVKLISAVQRSAPQQLLQNDNAAFTLFPRIVPPPSASSATTPDGPIYLGSKEVDKPALPTGEPNIQLLNGASSKSGLPIRLRVFIDAKGNVTKITRLLAPPADEDLVEKIINMMQQTVFMPAKRAGNDVASYRDLEFNISDIN